MPTDTNQPTKSVQELHNANLDRSVDPLTMVRGAMGKDRQTSAWVYLRVSADGSIQNQDAANFRVSALGVNLVDVSNPDAGDFLVSAKSGDGGQLRISALSPDASTLRTSAIQIDGSNLRVSAIIDSGSVSAKQSDAANLRISTIESIRGLTTWLSAFYIGTTGGVAVVNGVASKKICIYAINAGLNAAGGIKWQSGATDLQGMSILSASAGYTMAIMPPYYVLATISAGQDLNLGLSATGVPASGWVAGWSE